MGASTGLGFVGLGAKDLGLKIRPSVISPGVERGAAKYKSKEGTWLADRWVAAKERK